MIFKDIGIKKLYYKDTGKFAASGGFYFVLDKFVENGNKFVKAIEIGMGFAEYMSGKHLPIILYKRSDFLQWYRLFFVTKKQKKELFSYIFENKSKKI